MQTTTQPRGRGSAGRASARVAGQLRSKIAAGGMEPGQFLANERELATQMDVSRETLRRALKLLENEGLLRTVPRRGYQVLARGNGPEKGSPVAYVISAESQQSAWSPRIDAVLSAFQREAARRGWPLLVVGAPDVPAEAVLKQLRTTRACGLVLDTGNPAMLAPAREAGVPAIVVNDWMIGHEVDSVMQDGQHGGLLAVEHLVARGRRRIAWVGAAPSTGAHAFDRFSGTAGALARAGLALDPALVLCGEAEPREEQAVALLSRRDRPDGVVAPWSGTAHAVAAAADRLGLVLGRDLDMVGWCVDELYTSDYVREFKGGVVPPAVTWSAPAMAATALARIEERRVNPQLPIVRIKVPVRLRTGG